MDGVPRITGFLISLVLIALFAGTFTYIISGMATNYNVEYDDTKLESYDIMNNITQEMRDIESNAERDIDPNVLDILGSYLSSGYDAVKISFKSVKLFRAMTDDAMKQTNVAGEGELIDNNFAALLKDALILIVLILFFIGIVVSILVKRERL